MKNNIILVSIILSILSLPAFSQKGKSIIAPNTEVEKLADKFSFTEGPAVDKKGNIYFTDQPNDKIYKWSTKGELSVFNDNTGRANGLYFDRKGNLLACSDMDNEIWSFSKDGSHSTLITDFEGKKLNGPNDLWIHPNGNIYFTDPLYKRDYWTRNPEIQQDGEYVYLLSADYKSLIKVTDDLVKPNGIIGSPDGKLLYVADIGANKTYVYDIKTDGSLTNKRLFTSLGSDGMTIDQQGNIYLTGRGVTVFNPLGEQIEHIAVDAGWTANVCFGGKDMKTLFITASQYLYALRMNVKGVK
ncbi:MAG: SMP-30/gluconolactonase/LRE family protein [Prevotella sp.]|jgi:gluconolactonase|nr:SMP-30/gluconolactonase/LRE family protein [Prevotella sp.]